MLALLKNKQNCRVFSKAGDLGQSHWPPISGALVSSARLLHFSMALRSKDRICFVICKIYIKSIFECVRKQRSWNVAAPIHLVSTIAVFPLRRPHWIAVTENQVVKLRTLTFWNLKKKLASPRSQPSMEDGAEWMNELVLSFGSSHKGGRVSSKGLPRGKPVYLASPSNSNLCPGRDRRLWQPADKDPAPASVHLGTWDPFEEICWLKATLCTRGLAGWHVGGPISLQLLSIKPWAFTHPGYSLFLHLIHFI